MANVTVPGIYHFSLHGNVSGTYSIEEYSIGVYTNDENELISAPGILLFFYDNSDYDQVVNFNAAKLEDGIIKLKTYFLLFGFIIDYTWFNI